MPKAKSTKLNKNTKEIIQNNLQSTLPLNNSSLPPVPPSSPQIISIDTQQQQQQLDCWTCKPDIALENLVNMLHKLAFGENTERLGPSSADAQMLTEQQQQQSKKYVKTKNTATAISSDSPSKSKEEQIKRKEILLKELQKIEKQLEEKAETQSRLNTISTPPPPPLPPQPPLSAATTPGTAIATTNRNKSNITNSLNPEMTNYQRICIISKYLINKCEDDLNKIRENISETTTTTTTTTTTILTSNGATTKISTRKSRNNENQQQQNEVESNNNVNSNNNQIANNNRILNKYLENIMKTPTPALTSTTQTSASPLQQQDAEFFKNLILSTQSPPLSQTAPNKQVNQGKKRSSKIDELQQQLSLLLPSTIENLDANNSNIQAKQQQQQIISNSLIEFKKFYNSNSQSTLAATKLSQESNDQQQAITPTNIDLQQFLQTHIDIISSTTNADAESIATTPSSDVILSSLSRLSIDTPPVPPPPPHHCHCHRHLNHNQQGNKSDDWISTILPTTQEQQQQQQYLNNNKSSSLSPTSLSKSLINLEAETDSNHDTALTLACQGGHDELVRLLIEKGSNIEHRDKKGFTPLILAATSGYTKIVQILIDHNADIEAQSERTKDTALSAAAQGGRYEVVEILLKNGANKEHRNLSDYTPLSLAASGGYVSVIKLLLENNVEINSRTGSKLGISPLMLAAMNGHTQAVKLLLDMGSDINAQIETNRNTALTLACFQGKADVVNLLLERKANIEHRAKTGLTPLMEAASGGYESVGRVLIDKGADVNAPPVPVSKDTALTIAADKGHAKFAQLLIENGGIIDARNKKGFTPLWLACNSGHLDVCQQLVSHGANADIEDLKRISCLMAAFRKGHVKIVKYMVKHVKQYPSDTDCMKYIATLSDKDLAKKCQQCMEIIINAKEKQAQEANKIANSLLKEIDAEKIREKSKKAAAARKREKRKMKKKIMQQKEEEDGEQNKVKEEKEKEEDEEEEEEEQEQEEQGEDKNNNNNDENELFEKQIIEQKVQINLAKNKKKQKKHNKKSNEISKIASVSAVESIVQLSDKKPYNSNQQEEIKKIKKPSPQPPSLSPPPPPPPTAPLPTILQKPQHNHESSLAALDDFEPISQLKSKKQLKSNDKNNELDWKEVTISNNNNNSNSNSSARQKRIQIPNDKYMRVIGRGNNNIKAINELTGATLEIEKQTQQTLAGNNGDKFIIIKGTNDSVKYATQLLMALISNSDSDLVNLLPNNKITKTVNISSSGSPSSGNSIDNNNNTKQRLISNKQPSSTNIIKNNSNYKLLNKNNPTAASSANLNKTHSSPTPPVSWATTAKNPIAQQQQSTYNPLFGSTSLLTATISQSEKNVDEATISKSNSNTAINTIKRNFAEVAKQSLTNNQQQPTQSNYKRNTSISPSLLIPASTAATANHVSVTPSLPSVPSSNHVKILKSDYPRVNVSNITKTNINTQTATPVSATNTIDDIIDHHKQHYSIKQKPVSVVQPSYSSISQSAKQSHSTPSLINNEITIKSDEIDKQQVEYLKAQQHQPFNNLILPTFQQQEQQLEQQNLLLMKNSNQLIQSPILTSQKLFQIPMNQNNQPQQQQQIIFPKHQQFYNQSNLQMPPFLNGLNQNQQQKEQQISPISLQRQQQYSNSSTSSHSTLLPMISPSTYTSSLHNFTEASRLDDNQWLKSPTVSTCIAPALIATSKSSGQTIINDSQPIIDKPIPAPIGHERHGKQHQQQNILHQQKSITTGLPQQQNQQFYSNRHFNGPSQDNENYLKCMNT